MHGIALGNQVHTLGYAGGPTEHKRFQILSVRGRLGDIWVLSKVGKEEYNPRSFLCLTIHSWTAKACLAMLSWIQETVC